MSLYQTIKNVVKKSILVGGLVAVISGCESQPKVNQVLADVNRDGKKDIVNYMFDPSGWGSWDMYSAKGNGDGTFQDPVKIRHYKNQPQ